MKFNAVVTFNMLYKTTLAVSFQLYRRYCGTGVSVWSTYKNWLVTASCPDPLARFLGRPITYCGGVVELRELFLQPGSDISLPGDDNLAHTAYNNSLIILWLLP